MSVIDEDYQRLRKTVDAKLHQNQEPQTLTSEYQAFKKQYLPRHLSIYETLCKSAESLNVKPPPEQEAAYAKAIETVHLSVTPKGAYGLALLVSTVLLLLGIIFSLVLPFLLNGEVSIFFFLVFVGAAGGLYIPIQKLPFVFADSWRQKASNQMVLCLFYVVTYMRHTSNLERAIDFAADHIGPPLSLDLKKVIWDVQTERYSSLQESLDHYLVRWQVTNLEFVQAMNLVQGSLYETSNERRLQSLEKAMQLMLDETYEKMLHYAQNLKSPMTMLHMLGVILPILGLVILPLAVSFVAEVKWFHIAVLYNIILPAVVFYLGYSILSNRPSGYGNTDILDLNPALRAQRDGSRLLPGGAGISTKLESILIAAFFLVIGFSPLIIHFLNPAFEMSFFGGTFTLQGYIEHPKTGAIIGPYGLGAALLSLFLTLGAGLGLAHYYNARSKNLIKIRNESKALEQEFASAMFQLGNRLGDGIPAELAFARVAETMAGTKSGEFFQVVAVNIQKMGMGVEQAIFDQKRGAILLYPSPIIESSMKVLIESSKKGPLEASKSLITMSQYIKEIHRVEERLRDLMSDVISSMRSQINFLTPAIAGIVVGITSMITTILGALNTQLSEFGSGGSELGTMSDLAKTLGVGLPTYLFQAIVGLYVVQITWILAYLVNGIENGKDDLNEEYEQGKGLQLATFLYIGIAFIVVLLFNFIAGTIMKGLA